MAEAKSQAELLSDGFLDTLSKGKTDYLDTGQLPVIEQQLINFAAQFIQRVQDNLIRMNLVDQGGLSTEIKQGDIYEVGKGKLELQVGYTPGSKESEYYAYQDEGVDGTAVKHGSRFSFKKTFPSKSMIDALEAYIKRSGVAIRAETQKTNLSALQIKRAKLAQLTPERQAATGKAILIKRYGIKPSGFFTDAINETFGQKLAAGMSAALGRDITVYIKQTKFDGKP